MKNIVSIAAIAAAALGFAVSGANAQTSTLDVDVEVQNACTFGTNTAVDFGSILTNYSADVDAAGSIAINCPVGVNPNITLGNGNNFTTTRRMASGGNFVEYQLYRSTADRTAGTPAWGTTVGTNTLAYTGAGVEEDVDVFGRIPSGQTIVAGTFTDTVQVALVY